MKGRILAVLCFGLILSACLGGGAPPAPATLPATAAPPTAAVQPSAPPPTEAPTTAPTTAPTEPPTAVPSRPETAEILEELGGEPCPDSDFTCITLSVPLDHFDPANPERIEVVFAVLPAEGERKGMFVTANGGPGVSGLSSADGYTSAFDPGITEHFDIIFFDQRGVSASGGLQCVRAATDYYQAEWLAYTPEQEEALVESARAFARKCVAEMGLPEERLPYFSTEQAVEDLEVFRQTMQDEKFWLYGESYGTQYAQTYAAAHPDRLAGLILDGTVDLTLSGPDFYRGQAGAFNDTLVDTLNGCSADPSCAPDFDGDALAFYDELSAEIAASAQSLEFPLATGERAARSFTLSNLETVASSELYAEGSRMLLLRALAAARRGDLVPLARLLYLDLALDSETLEPIPDPSYSDAVYYTVTCNDYSYFSGTPDERAEAFLRAGDEVEASQPFLSSIFYGDLPCIFWPTEGEPERPAALTAAGIPTLVLGATADPATPVENGESVFSRLEDGYLMTTQGGAHIIFGRGDACPDETVTAFLLEDQPPGEREIACDGLMFSPYLPLSPQNAADFSDPLTALIAMDDEIYYLPEYYYWDVFTPTTVGCPFGGTLAFEPSDSGDLLTFERCVFSQGLILNGTGGNNYDEGTFTLELTLSGLNSGELSYIRDDNEATYTLTGLWNGEPIELSQ